MTAGAAIRTWKGAAAAVLRAGECETVVLPSLGMLVASFTHRGDELVAMPNPLGRYREGHTTAIPLLYPWANRLSRRSYEAEGARVSLRGVALPTDDNGLPIHGLMLGRPEWDVTHLGATARDARVAARFDFGAHEDLLAAFPFPHELIVAVTLSRSALRIVTRVRPTGTARVPVAFGWHPYLRLPGARRDRWVLGLPARAHARLDKRGIPTGRARPEPAESAPLAGRSLDELYALGAERVLSLSAPGRRLTLTYDDGYPYAQVYSPAGASFCAIEPMTAPTDALVSGDHPTVRPGATFAAGVTIAVSGSTRHP